MQSLRKTYGETLVQLGGEMPELVVLDADLSKSTKTALFARAFPARFHDMGIAEQDMLSTAAGLATAGMVPFCSTFAIFGTGRAWEQLRNAVCYPNLDVKLVATHGGITVGQDGGSHQALEDLAVTRVIPNLRVVVPCDATETAQAVRAAARTPGPFYIRLPRGEAPDVHPFGWTFELGRWDVLREGGDVTLAACGLMVQVALEAAERLCGEGVEARVLACASLKPIDGAAIEAAARETGAVVTLEEHSVIGALGGAVCEHLAHTVPVPVLRLGVQDQFGQSGSAAELLVRYGLTADRAMDLCRKAMALRDGRDRPDRK